MFTQTRLLILTLLNTEHHWWYGLDIVKASAGKLSRGIIYTHLHWLEGNGFVGSRQENDEEFQPKYPGALRQRKYKITHHGMRQIPKLATSISSLEPEPA